MGTHPLQSVLADHLYEHPEFAMHPLGFVVEDAAAGQQLPAERVVGAMENALEAAQKLRPDRIVVGLAGEAHAQGIQQIIHLQQHGYRTEGMAEVFEVAAGNGRTALVWPGSFSFGPSALPSLAFGGFRLLRPEAIGQRCSWSRSQRREPG